MGKKLLRKATQSIRSAGMNDENIACQFLFPDLVFGFHDEFGAVNRVGDDPKFPGIAQNGMQYASIHTPK